MADHPNYSFQTDKVTGQNGANSRGESRAGVDISITASDAGGHQGQRSEAGRGNEQLSKHHSQRHGQHEQAVCQAEQ